MASLEPPTICSEEARQAFRMAVVDAGFQPDSAWIGGYVEYEWRHSKFLFEYIWPDLKNKKILEFGCNVGASAIVLAELGAKPYAIDISKQHVSLARLNAAQYRIAQNIYFRHCSDTRSLPFDDGLFEGIVCNSVLEYVHHDHRSAILSELDRVLKPGGRLVIAGTSNRLCPWEMHGDTWFVNWRPRCLDKIVGTTSEPMRGIWPWSLNAAFRNYRNLDLLDHGRSYFDVRSKIGMSQTKLTCLKAIEPFARVIGLSVGMTTPSINVVFEKSSGNSLASGDRTAQARDD